ncbi:MAG: ribosomal protein L13e [Nitrososphaerota archaeon]|nr:ribosomal protein L13e [Nitrososphaerota archaeon]
MSSTATKKPKGGKQKGVVKEAEAAIKKTETAVRKDMKKLAKEVEGRRPKNIGQPGPAGRPPVALVQSRHGGRMVSREGRGFSFGEISGAGLVPAVTSKWGLRVDMRRRSVIDGNVASVKSWVAHPSAVGRAKREAEGVERGVEKAGKEIEKEAEKVAAEAEKAVKKAGKEVKKAGKAVGERAEKKPRQKKKAS